MAPRTIRIKVNPDGSMTVNNEGNPDAERILKELSTLATALNGDPEGFKVEKHVHKPGMGHTHAHADGTIHTHG